MFHVIYYRMSMSQLGEDDHEMKQLQLSATRPGSELMIFIKITDDKSHDSAATNTPDNLN